MKSIGIIGGADGPTAVFVASSPINWWIVAITAVVVGVVVFVLLSRRKK